MLHIPGGNNKSSTVIYMIQSHIKIREMELRNDNKRNKVDKWLSGLFYYLRFIVDVSHTYIGKITWYKQFRKQ